MKWTMQAFLEENSGSKNGYYKMDLLTKYLEPVRRSIYSANPIERMNKSILRIDLIDSTPSEGSVMKITSV